MGKLIPTGISDFIEDFLKNSLGVVILDYQKVESGGEGYTVIYVSDLDEDQAEVLKRIGLEQVKDDLWVLCGFEVEVNRLKDSPAIKYFENLQRDKWTELIHLRNEIDNIFYKKCNKNTLFRTTHNTPKITLKWYGKLALDEPTFNDFIVDLHKLLVDSLPEKISKVCSSNFMKCVKCIRNAKIAHDSSKIKQLEDAEKYLNDLVGMSYFRYWYHFMKAQICIIDDGIDFLNEIKSKEGEIIEMFTNSKT
ncbi:MAG: hypothetical protein DRG33_04150 [Deltaproteobacteria bacterium]|nr:MAG: hypothetical protein DRG33_04150 [Deltaproteobacteria bacterium]